MIEELSVMFACALVKDETPVFAFIDVIVVGLLVVAVVPVGSCSGTFTVVTTLVFVLS